MTVSSTTLPAGTGPTEDIPPQTEEQTQNVEEEEDDGAEDAAEGPVTGV